VGARPLYHRALAIREKVLGPEHPFTAYSLNDVAYILHAQGDFDGARPYYERALSICEREYGPGHPNTSLTRTNLARLVLAQGAASEALGLAEAALAAHDKVLGAGHSGQRTPQMRLPLPSPPSAVPTTRRPCGPGTALAAVRRREGRGHARRPHGDKSLANQPPAARMMILRGRRRCSCSSAANVSIPFRKTRIKEAFEHGARFLRRFTRRTRGRSARS
jgi:tetratricopeptide (TPR) repeat protein